MEKNNILVQYSDEIMSLPLELDIESKLSQWLEASNVYYTTDEPLMSDEMFDELTDELKIFGETYPFILNIINTKIQTNDGLVDVDNVVSQMISLKKIKWENLSSISEINKFLNPKRQNLNLFYGIKLDGIAVKVSKQNGTTKILTRGGQDVTDLLINHPDIGVIDRPITHGELVIKKSIFDEKYSVENGGEYENPRNCIMGVLKQNPRDLDFIECTDGISPLANILAPRVWSNFNNHDLAKIYYELKQTYQYQIDGMVVGYETDKQEIKDNYPMNLVAVKFKSPTVRTKVIKIDWTQKKSGNLTPVIIVEPVKLDGSTINKATGYNYMNLKQSHIGIGSIVEITKSGDIIPVVKKVIVRSNEINMPDVDYIIKGKNLIAVNQQESEIYKFILGLRLLQIDGIGPVIAEKIGNIVNYDIIELFDNKYKPAIIGALGNGEVWNKFNIFYQTKTIGLDLLIELLQFNRCGKVLSKKFADIITGKTKDTSNIDKSVLLDVCKGEGFKKIQNSIKKLNSFGVRVIKPIEISENTITFELTGNPPNMTKQQFTELIKKQYPNSIHTTLTKDTKYLFTDDINSSSGKCNKARKYNITIMTYSEALSGKFKL